MKNKLFNALIGFALVAWVIGGIIHSFGGVDMVKHLGDGSFIYGFLKIPFCLWASAQLVRAFYSLIAKDMEFMAGAFKNEKAYMFAIALDIIATILGITWIAKYYWK